MTSGSSVSDRSRFCDGRQPPRYRLLDVTRRFAATKLKEANETERLQLRHGQAFASLADIAVARFEEMSDAAWLSAYAVNYDDWRVAFAQACERRDAEVASSTGAALCCLDRLRDTSAGVRSRMKAAFALLPTASPIARASLWGIVAGAFAIAIPEVSRLDTYRAEAAAWSEVGHRPNQCQALWTLARELAQREEWEAVDRVVEEARRLEETGWTLRQRLWPAIVSNHVSSLRGDLAGYSERWQGVLKLAQLAGADKLAAWSQLDHAGDALQAGDVSKAVSLGQLADAEMRRLNLPSGQMWARVHLCAAHVMNGELAPACAAARGALSMAQMFDGGGWRAEFFNYLALLATRAGQPRGGAMLLGFAAARFAAVGDLPSRTERQMLRVASEELSVRLVSEEIASLRALGAQLTIQQAEELADGLLTITSVQD